MFKKYSFLLNDWDYGKNLEDPKEVTYSGRSKYYWTDQKHMVTICSKSKQKKYKQYKEKKDV